MGVYSPRFPAVPSPPAKPVPVDKNNPVHAVALHKFEAERELDAAITGATYRPLPPASLRYLAGCIVTKEGR